MYDEESIDARNSMKEHRHYTKEEAEEDISYAIEQWRKEREKLQKKHEREQVNIWKDVADEI